MRNVQVYRAVAAIARHGSIRRAAEALAISPSALNRQILALEEELQAPLFERLSKGVRLSPAGEIYLDCFRAHLGDLERVASQVSDLSGLRAGTIRIGVGEELAEGLVPKAVATYQRQFPNVDFDVRRIAFDEVTDLLGSFEVELILAANPQSSAAIETVFAQEIPIVCLSGTFGDTPSTLRLSDLVEASLIAPTIRSGLRNTIDAAFAARRVAPRYALSFDGIASESLRQSPDMVQLALACAVDPAQLTAHGLRSATFEGDAIRAPIVQICRARGRNLPVAAAKFTDHLARALSGFAVD